MTTRTRLIILAVVAVVIVATALALPGYAKNKLTSTLKSLNAEVKSFGLVNTLESQGRSIYRMQVTLHNNGTTPVTYTAQSLIVKFTPNHEVGANGAEQGTLRPGESVDLDREFSFLAPVVADLREAETLNIRGILNLEASTKWLFWNRDSAVRSEIRHTILFD